MSGATQTQPAAPEATGLGQSAHDKAMIAKVDATHAAVAAPAPADPAAATKPQRPADVPEKFWDAEKGEVKTAELLKSYSELEKGKSAATQEPAKKDPPPAGSEPTEAEKAATEAAKAAGGDTSKIDFAALAKSFEENGKLTDADYASLEKAGLGKDVVDEWIEGREAIAREQLSQAYGLVGGQEKFDAMLAWASTNLSQDERDAFDTAVVGTPAQRKLAIEALNGRYTAAMGSDPDLTRGNNGGSGEGGYQSRAEVVADMKDPRYAKDPAFRKKVEQKLAISNVF